MERELTLKNLQQKAAYITTYLNYSLTVAKTEKEYIITKKKDGNLLIEHEGTSKECELYLNGIWLFVNPDRERGNSITEIESTRYDETLKKLRIKAAELSVVFNFLLRIERVNDTVYNYRMIKSDDITDKEEEILVGSLEDCAAFLDGLYSEIMNTRDTVYSHFITD